MARTKTLFRLTAGLAVSLAALLFATPVLAATTPSLRTAASFAVLAGTKVTCTGSTVTGKVGVSLPIPTGAITGFPPCTSSGGTIKGGAAALAYSDFLSAYTALAPNPPCDGVNLAGTLAGVTKSPGTYCLSAEKKTGTLTLDAQGNANAVWIFQIGTGAALTGAFTGGLFNVVMAGLGNPCNVYWWVGQGATMTDSNLKGTILAGADITFTGGTLNGRALAGGKGSTSAPTGAVTLTDTKVTGCPATSGGGGGGGDDNGNGGGDDHHGDGDKDDHHGDGDKDDHHGHHGEGRSHDDD